MKTTRRAFTLVELLVALAVVAFLAALLFPALASAREQGRKATCISNLHQLYVAVALYAADNDRYLPPYDVRVSGADLDAIMQQHAVGDKSAMLVDCLRPYTHSPMIWFCPSDVFAHSSSTSGNVRHQFLSYNYNTPFMPYYDSTPRRIDEAIHRTAPPVEVLEPCDLELFEDASKWYRDADHPELFEDASKWYRDADHPVPFYSHNGLFNTVYLDGHVRALP